MNEVSPRSHCVCTLTIFGVNEGTGQKVQGTVNLIDLAGCERLDKSGATGDRLKETQAINKSLSCLTDVIVSISKKEEHVPFRNSKLTYLLEPCLSGGSKTLMLVNLSPEVSSPGESICSLRFAARVNSCEISIPRRQIQHSTDSKVAATSSAKSTAPPSPAPRAPMPPSASTSFKVVAPSSAKSTAPPSPAPRAPMLPSGSTSFKVAAPSFAKSTAPPSPAPRAPMSPSANTSFPPPTPPPPLTHRPPRCKIPPFPPRTLPGRCVQLP
ncbi:hypothetical protein BS78_10G266400 [Paspalum vaginatum]|nr:hypothetical protein BS78_10G266400 [Paspalum vaginatum]